MPETPERERLRPGINVDVVGDFKLVDESVDVRRASVYDVIEKQVILSQTKPPISRDNIGRKIRVTYLVTEERGPVRYGIIGRIEDIVDDYQLLSSDRVPVLIVQQESEQTEENIRMFFRVKPWGETDIRILLDEEEVSIVDISIGGARFVRNKTKPIKTAQTIKLILKLDDKKHYLRAKVINIDPMKGKERYEKETMSVQFLDMERSLMDQMAIVVREAEREMMKRSPAL